MTICGFGEAWIGPCKAEVGAEGERCEKHRGQKCDSCGADATGTCAETMGLVCGTPLCNDCTHTLQSNGCNSRGELPPGLGAHCKKTEQVFKGWYEEGAKEYNAMVAMVGGDDDEDLGVEEAEKKETLCNLCGFPCTAAPPRGTHSEEVVKMHTDYRAGLIDARADGGYESTPGNGYGALDDMTAHQFSLCEFCLDWLFAQFVIPVKAWDYGIGEAETWRPAAERVEADEWRKGKAKFFQEAARRSAARKRSV